MCVTNCITPPPSSHYFWHFRHFFPLRVQSTCLAAEQMLSNIWTRLVKMFLYHLKLSFHILSLPMFIDDYSVVVALFFLILSLPVALQFSHVQRHLLSVATSVARIVSTLARIVLGGQCVHSFLQLPFLFSHHRSAVWSAEMTTVGYYSNSPTLFVCGSVVRLSVVFNSAFNSTVTADGRLVYSSIPSKGQSKEHIIRRCHNWSL